MLRINPTRNADQAKSYYGRGDYYLGDRELPGVWGGTLAERLGLAGAVAKADFEALCDNRRPDDGSRITARTRADRTVGYDFNFHAPKSLSLLHALGDDARLLPAFQESVEETMRLIEADLQARVRKGSRSEDRTTGTMVWARFDHLTARPIDGVPDPHLHGHCFVPNLTYDAVENEWKAGQFRELKRDAPFYQAVFHGTLTAGLSALGYPIERTAAGWEVGGFERATLTKFSRRTARIEALAAELGIESPEAKAELGARTREGKAKHLSLEQLRTVWRERMDADESIPPTAPSGSAEAPVVGLDVQAALSYACNHHFERSSVVAERQLLAEMLHQGLGRFGLDEANEVLRASDVLVREVDGRRLATTRDVLAEERRLIAFARDGRGRCVPLGRLDHRFECDWLNAGQRAAVTHVLHSPDRVLLIRGAAGSGKTTLMREAVAGIEAGGRRVFPFAPSAAASRGVLREEGFADADTVARLLVDAELQERTRGQVLWIDEAGLLGTKAMAGVFALAERNDCRVVLSGDRRQHGSVERGAVLRILERQAGVIAAEVREIQRQTGAYKAAVAALAEGDVGTGFAKLDALGWIKEVGDADRYAVIAEDYATSTAAGRSTLIVAPTHAEGDLVTAAVRAKLREAGRLDGVDHRVVQLTRVDLTEAERGRAELYRPGDVLQFHRHAKGHPAGTRHVVREGEAIPVGQATRF